MKIELSFICKYAPKSGLHIPAHSHNCHEIVLFGSGCNGTTTIEGEKFDFVAGDLLLTPTGLSHYEDHKSDGKLIYFGFVYNGDFNFKQGVYHNVYDAKTIVDRIISESINQNYKYEEVISHKLNELLIQIERSSAQDSGLTRNLIYSRNYINENYMQAINIYDLAKTSGYSYDHFRHLFKKRFGVSPKSYLVDVRCKNAIELLQHSNYKCTDIAYTCGFSDSGQMTKILKNRFGLSPLAIRKKS